MYTTRQYLHSLPNIPCLLFVSTQLWHGGNKTSNYSESFKTSLLRWLRADPSRCNSNNRQNQPNQHGHSLSVQNIDFYLPSTPFCHHFIQEQDTCLSSRPSKKYITLLKLTTELKTSFHLFLELKINIFELFELLVICSRVKPVSTRFKVVTA